MRIFSLNDNTEKIVGDFITNNENLLRSFLEKFYIIEGDLYINSYTGQINVKGNIYSKINDIIYLLPEGYMWDEVKGNFNIVWSRTLTSLKGAPKKVKGNFNCSYCDSLTSLEGAPEEVEGNFNCSYCDSLTSLKGAPKKVKGNFNCSYCKNIEDFYDIPREVGGRYIFIECNPIYLQQIFDKKLENNITS